MYIKVKLNNETELFDVSKQLSISKLKEMIEEKMDVEKSWQRLIYKGKQLSDENTLFDYSVNINEVIQLWKMKPIAPVKDQENKDPNVNEEDKENSSGQANGVGSDEIKEEKKPEIKPETIVVEEKTASEMYKIGDLVDIRDIDDTDSAGGYFEGEIVRITAEEGPEVVAGCDGLTYYVKYDAYDGDDYKVKLDQLRPRARKILKSRELEPNMDVLVNYSLQDPGKRGFWFRAKVEKVRPHLLCTLFVGVEETPVQECKIIFAEEVFRLEEPVRPEDRDEKLDHEMNTAVERKHPPKCEACMDNPRKKCKECGCAKCGGKNDPETIIICDECQSGYHLKCIGLQTLPEEEEWFCPSCKNEDDIVKAGQKQEDGKKKKKMASKANPNKCTRDWGKGFATVGRTKECKSVDATHFGPIPGVEVGETWLLRLQVSEAGVHRPHVAVLSGGYEDDVDDGEEFTYTGSGGRDLSGNKRTAPQSSDQELTRQNGAIARNCKAKFDDKKGGDAGDKWREGKPIRVVRGYKGKKHSKYAPDEGCRYDGIYKVVKYWPQKGQAGFIVWRYLLKRDDPDPAPWTKEGKKRIEEGGWGEMQYPEGYLEAQAKKLAEKAAALGEEDGKATGKGKKRKNEEDGATKVTQKKVALAKYKIQADILQGIKKDKMNVKVWDEICAMEFKIKKDLVQAIEDKFSCVLCMEILSSPVTLKCLHNFCQACIKRGVKSEGLVCPLCRGEIEKDQLVVNEPLRDVLGLVFPGSQSEDKQ